MYPVFCAEEREGREQRDDDHQYPGKRRGIAHAEETESFLIEVERVEQRRIDGPTRAFGDDEGWREGLEGVDGLDDSVEKDHRRQKGQRNTEELPHFARAIDFGGLVHILRNLSQTSEEDDHRRTELPDRQDDQSVDRIIRIGNPARSLVTESLPEDHVDETVRGEKLAPENGDCDTRTQQRRQIEDCPVEGETANAAIESERHQQREDQLQRHRQQHIGKGDLHGGGKFRVGRGDAHIIGRTNPVRRLQQVVIGERQIKRRKRRAEGKAEKADEPGQKKQVGVNVAVEHPPHAAPLRESRATALPHKSFRSKGHKPSLPFDNGFGFLDEAVTAFFRGDLAEADFFRRTFQDKGKLPRPRRRRRRQIADAGGNLGDIFHHALADFIELGGKRIAHGFRSRNTALHTENIDTLRFRDEEIDETNRLLDAGAAGGNADQHGGLEVVAGWAILRALWIRAYRQLRLVELLITDELVGMSKCGCRFARRQGVRFYVELVECLHIGGHAGAALAQIRPEREPFGRVSRIEADAAILRIKRLAVLAKPVFEARFHAARIGRGIITGFRLILAELGGVFGKLFPGLADRWRCRAGFFPGRLVEENGAGIDAEIDAVKLAIDPAGIDVHLAEILDLQALANILVQRRKRAATAIFEDVAIIHLDQVRRIAARHLGGKARPVIAPAGEFPGNVEIRLNLLIGCYRLVGAIGALLRTPPQHAKSRGLRLRRPSSKCC
ncbi:Hypothetical protein AT6N2_L0108 [Agrobacterium tumefaciens]|nr:Hypothetical protein AT6N2_L0108 [Agrobacterium tumefaciens]